MKPTLLRAAAAALAVAALAACNTEQSSLTGGSDNQAPAVALRVTATNDSVDVNRPMAVAVDAYDNLSLKRVVVTVDGRPLVDTTFTAATPRFSATFQVALQGVQSGTVLQVRAVAIDGAGNSAETNPAAVIAYDRGAPTVTVTAPKANSNFRAGDPVAISVQATDSSGVARLGYQIIRVSATGAVDTLQADSAAVSGAPVTVSRTFNTTIAISLPPGSYQIRGFARDMSGNAGVSAATIPITVQDPYPPVIDFMYPPADSNVTLGSSIIAQLRLTDNVGLKRLSIVGITTSGDPDLGVVDTVVRYDSVFAPVNMSGGAQSFRANLTDTTVRRLLNPKNPADNTTGALYLVARLTDVAGTEAKVVRRVVLVSGPRVQVLRPGTGAVAAPGKSLIVEVRAADVDGIRTLGYNVTGAFTATRSAPTPSSKQDTLVFVDTLTVPATATSGTFSIVPYATDNLGQPGSGAGVVVTIQSLATDAEGPLVYQSIRTRVEADDSILVRAIDPSGIASIGYVMEAENNGTLIRRDSITSDGSFTDLTIGLPLAVPAQYVGQKLVFRSFAYDARGNIGYSLPAGVSSVQSQLAAADPDTALVVYGRTFSLPAGGVAGDIAVDETRYRAYVSNLTFDRLEVWEQTTQRFNSKRIAVGSDPWGMFVDNSGDTLLVANSGGTNISRVALGDAAGLSGVFEVASRRIKTPNAFITDVTVNVDQAGKTHFVLKIYDYSDRPQYVAQSVNGDIYYSTKPTPSAPDGTLRRYMANTPFPDVQQIWQYGTISGASGRIAIINADSVYAIVGYSSSGDLLVVCDHAMNQNPATTAVCVGGFDPLRVIDSLRVYHGADAVGVSNLDVPSLALKDTTFVAAGGDRQWIAFGEGNTSGAGRVMMVQNPGNFLSPSINVHDLVNNASERVFGLAINRNSSNAAVHGQESYFFDVESPFHLRLQGKFNTFDVGAGIAFHPDNVGDLTPEAQRVAFIASANGTIEIADTYHYTSRGVLPVRANLYGPIRVARPWPGDDPQVVLKLFGLTSEGFIVIDVRASDIQPLPSLRRVRMR